MEIEPYQLSEEMISALHRFFNGEANPEDWHLIQKFKSSSKINVSSGNRGVAIQGGVTGSTIITGDTYNINLPSPASEQLANLPKASKIAYEHEIDSRGQVISELLRQEFNDIREVFREGKRQKAEEWVSTIRIDKQRWDALPDDFQAEIIRFEALMHILELGGIEKAKSLAETAEALSTGPGGIRLRAWIAYRENDIDKACNLLKSKTDTDSINLRAALLLEAGKVTESIDVLNFEVHPFQPNAESYRLRAINQLVLRNTTQAQLEIQTAMSLAPKWENVAYSSAVIDFFSAVSPAGLPDQFLPWPEPIEPELFLSDEESIERLEQAENIFKAFSESNEKRPEEITTYKIWLAATLFGHPEKREEGIALFKEIVTADLTECRAIAWLASFGIEFDYRKVRNALQRYIKIQEKSLFQIGTLISMQLNLKNYKQANYLLNHYQSVFKTEGANILWESRQISLLLAQKQDEKALEVIEISSFKTQMGVVKAIILERQARKTGNHLDYIYFLETNYEESRDPLYLLLLCRYLYTIKEWATLADYAEVLIQSVKTAEAVHLSVAALYYLKRFEQCLALLDINRGVFFRGQYPEDLRRARIECLDTLGAIPGAYAEAEALVQDAPTTGNLLVLAQENLRKADLKGLTLVGSRIIQQPDLSAWDCIRLAYWVRLVDRDLAKSFWKKAVSLGISDDLLTSAINVSSLIGLDSETDHLFARLHSLKNPEEYGIISLDITRLQSFAEERQELILDRNRLYQQGIVPIHLFANSVNITLVDLYHFIPEVNAARPDPLRQPPIMIRNAGRKLLSTFELPFPIQRVHFDLTSLLLAAHLEILGKVEAAFSPIFIPADTVTTLLMMIDQVNNQQITQIQVARNIDEQIRNGGVKVFPTNQTLQSDPGLVNEMGIEWVSLYEAARKNNGYLLDYYPIQIRGRGQAPEHLPEDSDQIVISCGSLLQSLHEYGPLSDERYQSIQKKFYDQAIISNIASLPIQGKLIYCWGNILDYFARTNLLPVLCNRFQIYISDTENQDIHQQIEGELQNQRVEQFLRQLLEHIKSGLENGTYQYIQISPAKKVTAKDIDENHPVLNCIRSLFLFSEQEGDLICIDDRYITSFAYREAAHIVGMDEILRALVWKNQIDRSEYYRLLTSMRAGNFRFIPLVKDELLFHIQNVRVANGEVVETQELTVLRCYLAACFTEGRLFQRPPGDKLSPEALGEVEFIRGFSEEVTDSIIELWNDENLQESDIVAYSDWILTNIYLDNAGLMHAVNLARSEKDDLFRLAISIVGFLFHGLHFVHFNEDQQNSKRKTYFDWLESRLLKPLFTANPTLIASVVDLIKYYFNRRDRSLVKGNRNLSNLLYQEYILDLPTPLFKRIEQDQKFMNDLGLRTVIHYEDVTFDLKDFYRGITNLVNHRLSVVHSLEPQQDIQLYLKPGGENKEAYFYHPVRNSEIKISLDIAPLLSYSPKEREQFLWNNKNVFDLPNDLLGKTISKIAVISNTQKRIDEYYEWVNSNIGNYYSRIRNGIVDTHSFNFDNALPPDGTRLLHHYRLLSALAQTGAETFIIEVAAQKLISDVGLSKAISRLIHFPISLPQTILSEYAKLPQDEREGVIKSLNSRAPSPLARLHIFYLAINALSQKEEPFADAMENLRVLLSEKGREEFKTFRAILNWAAEGVENWTDLEGVPNTLRLAIIWAHASRLYSTFVSAGVPLNFITDNFNDETNHRIMGVLFDRQSSTWFDIAHPRRISYASFLMAGISYALGSRPLDSLSEDVPEQFTLLIKEEIEQNREALFSFLRDDSQSPNILNSFLSSKNLANPADDLRQSTKAWVQETLNRVLQSEDTPADRQDTRSNWLEFYALIGDSPQNEAVTNQIIQAIKRAKFSQLIYQGNLSLGVQSLYASSLQLPHIKDEEARRHVKNELLELSRLLGEEVKKNPYILLNSEGTKNNEYLFSLLIETALNLSSNNSSATASVKEFANTVSEVIDLCPRTAFNVQRAVWRLYHDLPIDQSQELLSLLLKLRSK